MYAALGMALPFAKKHHLYETEWRTLEGVSPDKERAKFAQNAIASPFDESLSTRSIYMDGQHIPRGGGGGVGHGVEGGGGWLWILSRGRVI